MNTSDKEQSPRQEKFQTKKSLGQHFLRNKDFLYKVSDAISDNIEFVIEIGPGEGTLTELLLERAAGKKPTLKRVICIEKDHRLIPILEEKFKKEIKTKKLTLLHADFLKISDKELIRLAGNSSETSKKGFDYAIVGNIPYYITGAIFEKSLESKNPPKELVFLIQKEVADRICARGEYTPRRLSGAIGEEKVIFATKESILSLSIKAFGNPLYIATVDKGQFAPPPKVDSAIIKIEDISHNLFKKNKISIDNFFTVVKKGFAHKRKVLRSNLRLRQNESDVRIQQLGNMRAEDLTLDDWVFLTQKITTRTDK